MLHQRAESLGKKTAVVFLGDGETVSQELSYQDLDRRAREIAVWLAGEVPKHSRVLISLPPGIEFIHAFLATLYAGCVAVPAFPPRRRGNIGRLESIAENSQAAMVLSSLEVMSELPQFGGDSYFGHCDWKDLNSLKGNANEWVAPGLCSKDLAFLQYTSGSTGNPKGVQVSHGNLLSNQDVIRAVFEQVELEAVIGGWLPLYHDMGLIGTMLHPLVLGGTFVYMPPLAFIQKPIRWLRMNSDYRITMGGAPNFAYDLCVAKTTPEERDGLDLSAWRVAFNGAEPIRSNSLERFETTFAPYGFSKQAFCPCYGMAETTLMVTGCGPQQAWQSVRVSAAALRQNKIEFAANSDISSNDSETASALTLVSSGPVNREFELEIVDTSTLLPVPAGEVGEIWVAGDSVTHGYWNNPELSTIVFEAQLANTPNPARTYLRTGDLGFVHVGELFITGRTKDLIIINGENHYPQDIERTVENCHPDLTVGSCVAFMHEKAATNPRENGDTANREVAYAEQIYIAQEISRVAIRNHDFKAILAAAYKAVWEEHQVSIDGFLLLRPGGIPKTTSGKLQRQLTRRQFSEQSLPLVASWERERDGAVQHVAATPVASLPAQAASTVADHLSAAVELQQWLVNKVAKAASVASTQVDIDQPVAMYGLKSISIVQLTAELSAKLQRTLPPTLLFDYPTIREVSQVLVSGTSSANESNPRPSRSTSLEDPIAVVGLSCRFPHAESLLDFNSLLAQSGCAMGQRPSNRDHSSTQLQNGDLLPQSRLGAYLEQIENFDPLFFGISPREAEELDPQQRLMLEVCVEAFNHAGIPLSPQKNPRTGVFIGVSGNEYARALVRAGAPVTGYTATGNSLALIANRLSYLFNFRGPSIAVDTACSSSLVAVHLAMQSLAMSECEIAVAGGVNLQVALDVSESLSQAGMLSPSGRIRAFSDGADGFVRGEGCGAVLLKRLSHAERDGDRIFCVLRGSAVNQDGRSNGLTAPNGLAQQDVIRDALQRSGLGAADIDYIEAHGTGTELGDPIEMSALASVFAPRAERPLWIGSVKTNIGHLEGAAGIAGLIKTCLAIHHERIPAHINFERPSPHIDWQPGLQIPQESTAWPRQAGHVRRAGVSSFGFGGTNAHVIVEEAPRLAGNTQAPTERTSENLWLKVAAKTPEALSALALRYAAALTNDSELAAASLQDIAYAANTGRVDFACRAALCFATREELVSRLLQLADPQHPDNPLVLRSAASTGKSTAPRHTNLLNATPAGSDPWPSAMQRYVSGEDVDWMNLYRNDDPSCVRRRTVSLPGYAFQRQRCWFKAAAISSQTQSSAPPVCSTSANKLLGERLDVGSESVIYETDLQRFPELSGHCLNGESVFPAAGFLELAFTAGLELYEQKTQQNTLSVNSLQIEQALYWSPASSTRVQVVLQPIVSDSSGRHVAYRGEVLSRQTTGWQRHARFRLNATSDSLGSDAPTFTAQFGKAVDIDQLYSQCNQVGLQYKDAFRSLTHLQASGPHAYGTVALYDTSDAVQATPVNAQPLQAGSRSPYLIHPALLDGCLQSIAALLPPSSGLWLPTAVASYQVYRDQSTDQSCSGPLHFITKLSAYADIADSPDTLSTPTDQTLIDIEIYNAQKQLVASIIQLEITQVKHARSRVPGTALTGGLGGADVPPAILCHVEDWVPAIRKTERAPLDSITAVQLGDELRNDNAWFAEHAMAAGVYEARLQLDELSGDWIVNALAYLLGELDCEAFIAEEGLLDRIAIAPDKRPLFFRALEILTEQKILQAAPAGWIVKKRIAILDVASRSLSMLQKHPQLAPEIHLLNSCGVALTDVLRGDVDPLPILFNDKSKGSASSVYKFTEGAQVLNGLLVETVLQLVQHLPEGRALRVLELGGGTGATTRLLLEKLPAGRVAYTFTDIARSFITAAAHEFGDLNGTLATASPRNSGAVPSFRAEYLNIENCPVEQGFAAESFDLIIAANVLHATADLRQTIQNVEQLLTPGGQLMLLEGARPVSWMDLTFGLTDGWWRFREYDPMRTHPMISPLQWQTLLAECGFYSVDAFDGIRREQVNSSDKPAASAENVLILATKQRKQTLTPEKLPREQVNMTVFASRASDGHRLKSQLDGCNVDCQIFGLDALPPANLSSQLEAIQSAASNNPSRVCHIVFIAPMSGAIAVRESLDAEVLRVAQQLASTIRATIEFADTLYDAGQSVRFTLLTSGTTLSRDPLQQPKGDTGLLYYALQGLFRTLVLEKPEWNCRSIDLDPTCEDEWTCALDELIVADHELDQEIEIAFHGGTRLGRRLRPTSDHNSWHQREVLRIETRGDLNSLALHREELQCPSGDEIQIEVRAAGLNFRDILNALGKYPEDVPLGAECAGIVTKVGVNVKRFGVGDRVVAIAPDSMATHVTVPAIAACLIPDELDFSTAATLPVAYLSASVGLHTFAQLRPNQSVLIHSASGAVGLAAISLAKAQGATIFVTASEPKHSFLGSIGCKHIYDSRAKGFAAEILRDTEGRGVDVVLNLLDETYAEENLKCLAEDGSYIDITKPTEKLAASLAQIRPDVTYQCFDLTALLREDTANLMIQCERMMIRVASGDLEALPVESFSLQRAGDAFRKMQRALHIGKILLTPDSRNVYTVKRTQRTIRADRAYVIIGGLGDLGLLSARVLADKGAGLIALIGRSTPTAMQSQSIRDLESAGGRLLHLKADASDIEELRSALEAVRDQLPIAGVIHSAGVLADSMLAQLTTVDIEKVWKSKASIGWNLHALTQEDELDHFIMYSSLASVLGAPGQANHAAANAFLDGLADWRLSQNLPVSSINWGPWSEIGEAARRLVQNRRDLRGIGMINLENGRSILNSLFSVSDQRLTVAPLQVTEMQTSLQNRRLFELQSGQQTSTTQELNLRNQLLELPATDHLSWVSEKLAATLAEILGISNVVEISTNTSFVDLGLDSLTTIEFIDAISRQWDLKLPSSSVYDHSTINKFARNMIDQLQLPSTLEVAPMTSLVSQAPTTAAIGEINEQLKNLLSELSQWE